MTTPPHADIERGRARLRRGRAVTGLASAAVVATIVAGAALLPGGNAEIDRTVGPASRNTAGAPESEAVVESDEPPGDGYEYYKTRQRIKTAAREHLDPRRRFLDFSDPNVFIGGQDADGRAFALQTRIGWQAEGEKGLGLIMVGITDKARGYGGCQAGYECEPYTSRDGVTGNVGRSTDGDDDFYVWVKQADGDTADVFVHELFGNNSLVPSTTMNVSVDDAMALAADQRLTIVED